MADEVIGQLAGVTAQVKRYEQDPEAYQELLNEWNENFPASLGAYGTPKAVAQKLAEQSKLLEDLQQNLIEERTKR